MPSLCRERCMWHVVWTFQSLSYFMTCAFPTVLLCRLRAQPNRGHHHLSCFQFQEVKHGVEKLWLIPHVFTSWILISLIKDFSVWPYWRQDWSSNRGETGDSVYTQLWSSNALCGRKCYIWASLRPGGSRLWLHQHFNNFADVVCG